MAASINLDKLSKCFGKIAAKRNSSYREASIPFTSDFARAVMEPDAPNQLRQAAMQILHLQTNENVINKVLFIVATAWSKMSAFVPLLHEFLHPSTTTIMGIMARINNKDTRALLATTIANLTYATQPKISEETYTGIRQLLTSCAPLVGIMDMIAQRSGARVPNPACVRAVINMVLIHGLTLEVSQGLAVINLLLFAAHNVDDQVDVDQGTEALLRCGEDEKCHALISANARAVLTLQHIVDGAIVATGTAGEKPEVGFASLYLTRIVSFYLCRFLFLSGVSFFRGSSPSQHPLTLSTPNSLFLFWASSLPFSCHQRSYEP